MVGAQLSSVTHDDGGKATPGRRSLVSPPGAAAVIMCSAIHGFSPDKLPFLKYRGGAASN